MTILTRVLKIFVGITTSYLLFILLSFLLYYMPDFGTTTANVGTISYEMWIESSVYYARNISTGDITSNSNFKTLLQAVIDDLAIGAGKQGGTIYIRKGTYDCDGLVNIGNSSYASYRVRILGEGIDVTTIKRTGSAGHLFAPWSNFDLEDLTLDGNAVAQQLVSCGEAVYGRCENVKFTRHTDIGLWYGVNLKGFVTDKCIFEDPRGVQDQHAFTCTEYGMVTNCYFDRLNTVFTSAVRGGSCLTSGGGNRISIDNNTFVKANTFQQSGFGCSIEPWDRDYKQITITNNNFKDCMIRVGGGVTGDWGSGTNTMRDIVIDGNTVDGAEIGIVGPDTAFSNSIRGVTVTDNIIRSPWSAGIRLNFLAGQIVCNNNQIFESNKGQLANTFGDNGLVWIYNCTDVTFNNNKLYMTSNGTNETPYGLGISTCDYIQAQGNTFINTTVRSSYTDFGLCTNKFIKDNVGIIDEISHIRQRDSGTSLLRMHGNDNAVITFINAEAGPSPNQGFHVLPDYAKQGGATDVSFYFGYNADIANYTWLSKWSGSNKEYFKVSAVSNRCDFKTPLYIGDNLRLKLNETGLTAEREFTFPDKAGEVLTQNSDVAMSPIKKRWGAYQPIAPSSGSTAAVVGRLEGILSNHVPTGPGTNTNTWDTTEGLLTNLVTTTTQNQNAGLVSPTGSIGIIRRAFATKMSYRGKIDTVAGGVARLYFGVSSNSAPNISDTIANGDSLVLVGFKAADANYSIYHNDGTSTHATTAITGSIAKNTNFHTIEIEWAAGGNVVVTFDGTAQTISSDIPATTTNLFFHCLAQNATGAIRTHSIVGVWVESL